MGPQISEKSVNKKKKMLIGKTCTHAHIHSIGKQTPPHIYSIFSFSPFQWSYVCISMCVTDIAFLSPVGFWWFFRRPCEVFFRCTPSPPPWKLLLFETHFLPCSGVFSPSEGVLFLGGGESCFCGPYEGRLAIVVVGWLWIEPWNCRSKIEICVRVTIFDGKYIKIN